MNRSRLRPVILMTVLAILAGLTWTAPAHAAAKDVRPAAQPANCQGYTSGPWTQNHVSLVGYATTNCWNVDRWTSTWARATMWRANSPNGPWSWIGGGEAWGNFRAEARAWGSGTCGSWYMMTGEHSVNNGQPWQSWGTPIFWPCH